MTSNVITGSQAKNRVTGQVRLIQMWNFVRTLSFLFTTQAPNSSIVMLRLYKHPSHVELFKLSKSCHTQFKGTKDTIPRDKERYSLVPFF